MNKIQEWPELARLTQGRPVVVERVRIKETGIAIEGAFELPELATLSTEDQVFVIAFIRSHGSIKEMEQTFGVSYPTIKARLTRISQCFTFVESNPKPTKTEVLARLARGEVTAAQAISEIEGLA